jgi:putative PIN family toxin of toxin-antitoxin system
MTKAVFDTTVLVAALLTPKGLSRELIERARAKEFELCLSPEIIAETQTRLIKRQHLRKRYGYTEAENVRLNGFDACRRVSLHKGFRGKPEEVA